MRPKPEVQLYLCRDERAAHCCDNPCDHPAHHDQFSVVTVSKVPEDWSQQHEAANKNCKWISILPKEAMFFMQLQ